MLVVETYPSYGADLYMATGYGDWRFYRRGETRVNRMSEPEIREAYMRIAARAASLDEVIEENASAELGVRSNAPESVLVVPWYATRNLADPRLLAGLGDELEASGAFAQDELIKIAALLMLPCLAGMRGHYPAQVPPEEGTTYFAVTRAGVVHLSWNHHRAPLPPRIMTFRSPVARDWVTICVCSMLPVVKIVKRRASPFGSISGKR